jgi:hypothetical protein
MFQLRADAESLSLHAWLVCIVVLALVGGVVLALITDPLLKALRGPFPELCAALAAEAGAAALFNSAMLTLIGRWAIIPTWGLFIAIGNAASGGAVAPPLLPAFYRFVGRFLPNGATVETIRNAVYFTDHQHLEPILVEAAWITGTLVLLLIAARLSRLNSALSPQVSLRQHPQPHVVMPGPTTPRCAWWCRETRSATSSPSSRARKPRSSRW